MLLILTTVTCLLIISVFAYFKFDSRGYYEVIERREVAGCTMQPLGGGPCVIAEIDLKSPAGSIEKHDITTDTSAFNNKGEPTFLNTALKKGNKIKIQTEVNDQNEKYIIKVQTKQ